ncbi:MAG: cereblon family protein [Desulfobacterales bacterium]
MESGVLPAAGAPPFSARRAPPGGRETQGGPQPGPGADPARLALEEPWIRCRACGAGIARPVDRIAVGGRHRHRFANPYGIVFEIGCFAAADGCVPVGTPTEEFTWFSGHRWQVALCAACRTHLGWRFAPAAGNGFFGLILERLVEPAGR